MTWPAAVAIGVCATCAAYCAGAYWLTRRDNRALDADVAALDREVGRLHRTLTEVVDWLHDTYGDQQDTEEHAAVDTVESHPADTWARQEHVLKRYAHSGQHRK